MVTMLSPKSQYEGHTEEIAVSDLRVVKCFSRTGSPATNFSCSQNPEISFHNSNNLIRSLQGQKNVSLEWKASSSFQIYPPAEKYIPEMSVHLRKRLPQEGQFLKSSG